MSKFTVFIALAIFAVLANGQYLRGNTYSGSSCSAVSSLSYVTYEILNRCIGNVPAFFNGSINVQYTSGAQSFNQSAYTDNSCSPSSYSAALSTPLAGLPCTQVTVPVLGGASIVLSNQWSPVAAAGQAAAPAGVYWQNAGRATAYSDSCNTQSTVLYQTFYNPNCIPGVINNGGSQVPVAGRYVCNSTGIFLLSYLGSTSCSGTPSQTSRYFSSGCNSNVVVDCPAAFGTAPTTPPVANTTGPALTTAVATTGSSNTPTTTATTTIQVTFTVTGDPALVDRAAVAASIAAALGVPAGNVNITIVLITSRAVQQYRIIVDVIIAQTFTGSSPPFSASTLQSLATTAANNTIATAPGVNSVQSVAATSKTTTVTNTVAPSSSSTGGSTSTTAAVKSTSTTTGKNSASSVTVAVAVVAVAFVALLF